MRCGIWYHLYNLKNVKNTHGGVLILVKLQAEATFLNLTLLHGCFSCCLNCTQIAQHITFLCRSNCPTFRSLYASSRNEISQPNVSFIHTPCAMYAKSDTWSEKFLLFASFYFKDLPSINYFGSELLKN